MFGSVNTKKDDIEKIMNRYVGAFYPSREEVITRLQEGKKLKFYLGIDPTSPQLHIGHTVPLLLLKKLKELGHEIVLLIGDFTARIGDPTDKTATRKKLAKQEVGENMKTYLDQASRITPKKEFSVEYNSKWLEKLNFEDLVELASNFSAQQFLARDMFQERIKKEKAIGLHEFLYPLMQGYDSVAMDVDGEVGGNDQIFNMLIGRDLMKKIKEKDKIVLATRLLTDAVSGKKISKTEGSFIAINDKPADIFGKTMQSIPDEMIKTVFELCTEKDQEWINDRSQAVKEGENPRNFKIELAFELVKMYYDKNEAQKARDNFENVFSRGQAPENMPEYESDGATIVDILVNSKLVLSKTEAKRLVSDGAVEITGQPVKEWDFKPAPGDVVKIGSHRFLKIN